ncbi:hypothetical protein COOONC_06649 [Cooperia oncophora]
MSENGYDSFDDDIVITNPSVIDTLNSSNDSLPPTPPPAEGEQRLAQEGPSWSKRLAISLIEPASPAYPLAKDDDCDDFSDPPPTPPPGSTRKRKVVVESDEDEVDDQNLPPTPPPIEYELPKRAPVTTNSRSRDGTLSCESPPQGALQLLKVTTSLMRLRSG